LTEGKAGALDRVLPLPRQVTLFVAWPCNLRCRVCALYGVADYVPEYMERSSPQYMSWEIFQRVMDPLAGGTASPAVTFIGGEPTLHPRLAEMVRYVKRRSDAHVDMCTNGTQIPRIGEALVEAGIDEVHVSIDGASAAVNDPGRGLRSFDRALEGLRQLIALRDRRAPGLKVKINCTVSGENYADLVATAELADAEGVDEIFFSLPIFVTETEGLDACRIVEPLGFDFRSWRGFRIEPTISSVDVARLEQQLTTLMARRGKVPTFVTPIGYEPRELRAYFGERWPELLHQRSCPVQSFRTSVLPNGDVTSCTPFPDLVVGSLASHTLEEVWRSPKYDRFRELVDARLLPVCHRCCELFGEEEGC